MFCDTHTDQNFTPTGGRLLDQSHDQLHSVLTTFLQIINPTLGFTLVYSRVKFGLMPINYWLISVDQLEFKVCPSQPMRGRNMIVQCLEVQQHRVQAMLHPY